MGKITTKKRILFSFRGQVTINGQIMSEKPGIFCAQNGQKLWVFGQPEGGVTINVTFAPQITINNTETVEFDLMERLREEEENLVDMLADMLDRRGGDQYKASFG